MADDFYSLQDGPSTGVSIVAETEFSYSIGPSGFDRPDFPYVDGITPADGYQITELLGSLTINNFENNPGPTYFTISGMAGQSGQMQRDPTSIFDNFIWANTNTIPNVSGIDDAGLEFDTGTNRFPDQTFEFNLANRSGQWELTDQNGNVIDLQPNTFNGVHTVPYTNYKPDDTASDFTPDPLLFDNPPPYCFAAGTRIRTARGEVAIEHLVVGDLVVTAAHGGRGNLLARRARCP